MPLGECSNRMAVLTAALKVDGDSVEMFTAFMADCKYLTLTIGIELPAVPRGLAKRMKRGNRVD